MGTTRFSTEEIIRQWVDGLYSMGQQTAGAYWVDRYQQLYIPLVNVSVRLAIEGGFGLKTLSSVYVGSHFYVDRLLDFSVGVVAFTEGSRYRRCWEPFARNITVCFSSKAPSVDIPAWMMADYYRHRSEHYARRFGLSLSNLVRAGVGVM